ncbi:MAG TPA: energy transducer TonB, partial [Bacteroidales bacterium]|nr:energy transducer TonB [Bacteroidales bacterium]
MKGKDKNDRTSLPDLLKYMANKMSGKERNSFERELQKDPFVREAAEGLSGISASQAEKDIGLMKKNLEKRVSGRRIMIWYRIAASIAVIMVISSLFFFMNRNKKVSERPEIALNTTSQEIFESKAIIKPEKAETEVSEPNKVTESVKKKISSVTGKTFGEKARPPMGKDAFTKKADEAIVIEADTNSLFQEDQLIAAASAAEPDTENKAMPEPSVTALDEIVVVGYGVSKRAKAADEKADDTESAYKPPEPVAGRKEFDKYIEENIKKPVSMTAGDREVVVIRFTVSETGSIENIKVLKTSGDEFSKEAERLIKDGPAWNPAEKNGEKISDDIRIRII